MKVVLLDVMHYPPDGSHWQNFFTREPSWSDIEVAIWQLDRVEWPYLWLHTQPPIDGEMPENALCVMGGRGEYQIFLSKDNGEIHFEDASRSHMSVQIWESDQGSVTEERYLCNDFARVLGIVRHFTEFADLHPDATWVEW